MTGINPVNLVKPCYLVNILSSCNMKIPIDLLKHQPNLQLKKEVDKRYIWCSIRKKYLVLQPEELVRQLTIEYLEKDKKYNKNKIHVERGLMVNERYRRTDIIIYDDNIEPYLLVECKAPKIKMNQAVFDQIARYNLTLKVKYLLVTNGIDTFCCEMDYEEQSYRFLSDVPEM